MDFSQPSTSRSCKKIVEGWLENEDFSGDSDFDPDFVEFSDHDSASEVSSNEKETEEVCRSSAVLRHESPMSSDDDDDDAQLARFKGGVDSLDEKCSKISCSRRTRRWPCVIFFRMIDIAASNAFVLARMENQLRTEFIKNISKSLITPHLRNRLLNKNLHTELKLSIIRILGKSVDVSQDNISESEKLDRSKRKTMLRMSILKIPKDSIHMYQV